MKIESFFTLIFLLTLVNTIVILRFLIPLLRSQNVGQKILEIGPRWHKGKEGTPTMGGIAFIIASTLSFFLFLILSFNRIETKYFLASINIFVYALLNAMIGIIDDFAKLKKKKNEGLRPFTKFLFQAVAAILFLISLKLSVGINTSIVLPFIGFSLELGFFYYIIAFLLLCGVVNSVNLTDGIDGLASSVSFTVGVFFSVLAISLYNDIVIGFFGAIIIGSTLGFLVYNFYPAKIFMGDTGSLFLGGLIVSASFLIENPLLVLIYGFVFILEAISVILQVLFFKVTKGKRLFKMAPIHHHLEKSGLSEVKIVFLLTFINAIFCVIAFLGV